MGSTWRRMGHAVELLAISHLDNCLELRGALANALPVLAVHHKNESVRIVEVVPPQWPQLLLTADVPYGEHHVLVLHLLNVEAYRGYRCEDLANMQLVEDGGLPREGGVSGWFGQRLYAHTRSLPTFPAASRPSITALISLRYRVDIQFPRPSEKRESTSRQPIRTYSRTGCQTTGRKHYPS